MLNNLKPTEGSRKKSFKRCRGIGSGLGKNGGSGSKGQNSRAGGGVRLGFEGGQLPYFRRLSKRGFKHHAHVNYTVVNLNELTCFNDGDVVDATVLIEKGIISKLNDGLKVLAGDDPASFKSKITIKANKFSKKALEVIESAGATAEIL